MQWFIVFIPVLIFSGHFSQCRSSVEAWRFFLYCADIQISDCSASSATVRRSLRADADYPLHHFPCNMAYPVQYITLHYITLHFISTENRLPMTMHYCTSQLNSLPITWLPLHRSSSSIPAIIDALYNPTRNPSLNANGNRGDSDGYVGVLKKGICNPSPLYFRI